MKFTKRDVPSSNSNGSTLFLKLKDGESVTGVCRGEVYEFFVQWENGKSKIVEASDVGAKSRFKVNFVVNENGVFTPKIWEFGLVIYNQLAEIAEEYDITATKLKITRRGTGTDTVYMILPLLKEAIPAKAMKEISSLPLNMLEHSNAPKAPAKVEEETELEF